MSPMALPISRIWILILLPISSFSEQKFPCALSWTEVTFEDKHVDECLSLTTSKRDCLIRAACSSSTTDYDYATFIPKNGSPPPVLCHRDTPIFEVLMNPHSCKVTWESTFDKNSPFLVKMGEEKWVSRKYESGEWKTVVDDTAESTTDVPFIQHLTSSTAGLHLSISPHINFLHAPFIPQPLNLSFEFTGWDTFLNNNTLPFEYSVEHSKGIEESTSDTVMTYNYTGKLDSTLRKDYPTDTTDTTTSGDGNSHTTSQTNVTSVEVSTRRTVTIPGNSKLEACTVATMVHTSGAYNVTGTFTIPGHSGEEVAKVLSDQHLPFEVTSVEKFGVKAAIPRVRGRYYFMRSTIIVKKVVENETSTCSHVRTAALAWNDYRKGGVVPDIQSYEETLGTYVGFE